jgi:hypothetical protein
MKITKYHSTDGSELVLRIGLPMIAALPVKPSTATLLAA